MCFILICHGESVLNAESPQNMSNTVENLQWDLSRSTGYTGDLPREILSIRVEMSRLIPAFVQYLKRQSRGELNHFSFTLG